MFKLSVATLAALYAVLHVFGDPGRIPIVARDVVNPEVQGLTLATFADASEEVDVLPLATPAISDAEAVRLALAAGKTARAERVAAPLRGLATAKKIVEPAKTADSTLWYVSGTRVNLRQGPGTGNSVVAQVTLGTAAEVLERQNSWYQIRTLDGSASGWIYSKFLTEKSPG